MNHNKMNFTMTAAWLILFGRAFLAVVILSFLLFLLFDRPILLANALIILAVCLLMLVLAGFFLRQYKWILEILIQCIGVSAISVTGISIKKILIDLPVYPGFSEIFILFVTICVFVACVLILRKMNRKSRR